MTEKNWVLFMLRK